MDGHDADAQAGQSDGFVVGGLANGDSSLRRESDVSEGHGSDAEDEASTGGSGVGALESGGAVAAVGEEVGEEGSLFPRQTASAVEAAGERVADLWRASWQVSCLAWKWIIPEGRGCWDGKRDGAEGRG